MANQAPELFRALVAEVPFVDCVTTMLDDELPLTVGEWEEWGNPLADESAYCRMLTYSPYDNVTGAEPGRARPRTYPDLFVTAGLNDPRVAYWEPAKWVAKLRAALALDPGAPQDRARRRPRRAVGPLRRLEGGGPGARLPARRPRRPGPGLTCVDALSAGPGIASYVVVVVLDDDPPPVPGVSNFSVNGAWNPGAADRPRR